MYDIINDPYEDTNLYSSSKSEHISAKEELYNLIPDYMSKARVKESYLSDYTLVHASWRFANWTVVPWVDVTSETPVLCDFSNNDDDMALDNFPTTSPARTPTINIKA